MLEAFDGVDAAAAVERRLPLAALHLPPDTLKGVPILFINGKAMAGYSESNVRKLLGR